MPRSGHTQPLADWDRCRGGTGGGYPIFDPYRDDRMGAGEKRMGLHGVAIEFPGGSGRLAGATSELVDNDVRFARSAFSKWRRWTLGYAMGRSFGPSTHAPLTASFPAVPY